MKKIHFSVMIIGILLLSGCGNKPITETPQNKYILGDDWSETSLTAETEEETNCIDRIDDQHFSFANRTFFVETDKFQEISLAALDTDSYVVQIYEYEGNKRNIVCEYTITRRATDDAYMKCDDWFFKQHVYTKEVPLFEVRTANRW